MVIGNESRLSPDWWLGSLAQDILYRFLVFHKTLEVDDKGEDHQGYIGVMLSQVDFNFNPCTG